VVYMKAKLEAAKVVMSEVQSETQKTKDVAKEGEKVFVEVEEAQEELAKAMKQEHKLEMKTINNAEVNPSSREDSMDSRRQAAPVGVSSAVVDLDPVLQKLDLTLQKLHDIAQLETDLVKRQEVEDTLGELNIPRVQKDFEQIKAQPPKTVDDDLEDVKNLWIRYYREAPVPQDQGFVARLDWVKHDGTDLKALGQMLNTSTQEQYNLAMEQYGQYLQFVMLGEFSLEDITRYIDVRLAAAEFVVKELELAGNAGNPQSPEQVLVDKTETTLPGEEVSSDQQMAEVQVPKE